MKKKDNKLISNSFAAYLSASSIGLVFIFSIVIGVLMGVWLDSKFGTKPKLTIFFMFIGIAAGIKNAYFFIKKSSVMDPLNKDSKK